MKIFKLKLWEKVLVSISILLCIGGCFIFLTGFPIGTSFFGLEDTDLQLRVGSLIESHGSVRRQFQGAPEFEEIRAVTPLYNMDLLMTGPQSGAILQFDDGTSVSVEPSSMVRLTFTPQFALASISRFSTLEAKLEVFSGALNIKTAQTQMVVVDRDKETTVRPHSQSILEAEQSHSASLRLPKKEKTLHAASGGPPSSDGIELLDAREEHFCSFDSETQLPVKTILLTWKTVPAQRAAWITLWKVRSEVKSDSLRVLEPTFRNTGSMIWRAHAPGHYLWQVSYSKDSMHRTPGDSVGEFTVTAGCPDSVHMLPPRVGGVASATSNRLVGDLLTDFDVTLRWEGLPHVSQYRIWLGRSLKDPTPFLEKMVEKPELTFNKNKIFTGRLYYQVFAKMPNDFVMTSGGQEFTFTFLPPRLVMPEPHAVLTFVELKSEKNRVLFTWEKTSFTTGYQFEIAKDPNFQDIYLKKILKDNFLNLTALPVGQYWWRVRSFAEDISSEMSPARHLTLSL